MNVEQDIKAMEKKIVADYSSDGIIDFLMGITFIGVGFTMLMDRTELVGIFLVPLIFTKAMRKKITFPRIGYTQPDNVGNSSLKAIMILVLLVLTVAIILLGVIAYKNHSVPPFLDGYLLLFGAALVAGYLISTAIITGIKRFYLYALLVGGIFVLGHFLHMQVAWYVFAMGLISFIVGSIWMIRFKKRYPILDDNEIIQS